MKKVIPFLLFAFLLPLGLSAEAGFGVVGFFQSPVLMGHDVNVSGVGLDDFAFGGNARFKFSFLQIDGLVLGTFGDGPAIDAYLDGELALDLLFLRLSAGVGPNVMYRIGADRVRTGLNAKANADIRLGRVSFGVSYIMALDATDGISLNRGSGLLGISLLIW